MTATTGVPVTEEPCFQRGGGGGGGGGRGGYGNFRCISPTVQLCSAAHREFIVTKHQFLHKSPSEPNY